MTRFIALWLIVPVLAQTRIIPHLTRPDGGFTTDIIIENTDLTAQTSSVEVHSVDGSVTLTDFEVEGLSTRVIDVRDLNTSLPSPASHMVLEDGNDLLFHVAYRNATGPGSPAQVGPVSELATRIRFFAGDWSEVFDGVAVVNAGTTAADLWLSQRNTDGSVSKTTRIATALAPNRKALYVVGGPAGSDFDLALGDQFEISATQPLAITALRGTVPGAPVGFLWANVHANRGAAQSVRDAQGVWFITQGSHYDVFEMMGYNVASDRMWQADLFRRSARGTLAAILGADYLEQDVQARTVGYSDDELDSYFTQLETDAKDAIRAYVDGFNRRIHQVNAVPDIMPFEYVAVGISAETWSIRDCMAWLAFLQREFDPNDYAIGQMENAAFFQDLNTRYPATAGNMFEDFHFANDPDAPTMAPFEGGAKANSDFVPAWQSGVLRDDINFAQLAQSMRDRRIRIHRALEAVNARVKMGSYAWAVSGDNTVSGNAIIYSGPQMGFSAPAITVEGSIRGGGLEVSGMSVPGIPGIIIGRTPHHAWSMQVGHAHTSDLYIEPPSALSGGPHHLETIQVRGGDPVTVEVYRTNHGPVVSQSPIVAWKYAHWGYEFDTISAFLALARTTDLDDFGDAIAQIGVSQHFCYADRDGNIAYWMSGRDPIRPEGDYRFPQGSFSSVLEYDVAIRRDLAHAVNPEQGFFGGWNNKASADYDNAPYGGTLVYGPAHRAHAIQDFLSNAGTLSFEDIRDAAINIGATDSFGSGGNPWVFVDETFTSIVNADPTPERSNAIAILNAWDGHFVDGGELRWILGQDRADAWYLMDRWLKRCIELTFDDELPDYHYAHAFQVFLHALGDFTVQTHYDWFLNSDPSAPQNVNDIVLTALDDTLMALGDRPWGVDQRGTIDFIHPLLPAAVWSTPFSSRSTYAHCVEYGPNGPIRIESMFPLGQSGLITASPQGIPLFSPQFFGMTLFFDNFNMRRFPLFN